MTKTRIQLSITANVAERYKNEVDNVSQRVEQFMRRELDESVETVDDVEQEIGDVQDKINALESKLSALQVKRTELANTGESGVDWVCYDCGETGHGDADGVDRCPGCRGTRVREVSGDTDI